MPSSWQNPSCFAGATGCNWVVVVNGESVNSRTVANHYAALRNIPARNIIVLPNVPNLDLITVDTFREVILLPVLKEIEVRGLMPHVQGVAYSVDFPTAIDLHAELANVENLSPYLTKIGSINGLTYLFRYVLAKSPGYIGFDSNHFAARPADRILTPILSSKEQQASIELLIKESRHEELAVLLDEMTKGLPAEIAYPIYYLAAQRWSLAGNPPNALKRLEQSIRGGWCYRDFLLRDSSFASLLDNKDFQRISKRCKEEPFEYLPSRGFDVRTFYAPSTLGSSDPKYGISYMPSMVLGVTRDLGITKTEALFGLEKSVRADYSFPKGAFLFSKTSDVRTTTREPGFALAIKSLKSRGMNARVFEQMMPSANEKCSGVMMGAADFSWNSSGAELLPGAIAENLTSMGGAMTTPVQTKATEFLRYGAAATSGTVTEPYTIPNKFPHPMIHAHYVDGLTAAEAFYSSVICPYQLLIVGDPLCQPFCKAPKFESQITSTSIESGSINIALNLESSDKSTEPEFLQLLLDGIVRSQTPFEPKIQINFHQTAASAHEIRLVSIAAKPIEERFQQSVWIRYGKASEQLIIQGPERWSVSGSQPLRVSVTQRSIPGEVKIYHDFELLGSISESESFLELSPSLTGYGPVRIHATQQKQNEIVQSVPITLQIE